MNKEETEEKPLKPHCSFCGKTGDDDGVVALIGGETYLKCHTGHDADSLPNDICPHKPPSKIIKPGGGPLIH